MFPLNFLPANFPPRLQLLAAVTQTRTIVARDDDAAENIRISSVTEERKSESRNESVWR